MKVLSSKILTYSITGIILLSGVLFAFMVLSPVDVLKNWTLTVDATKEYPEGSTIVVNTKFDKLRSVTGIAKRYLVCDTPNRTTVRAPINESDADRQHTNQASELIYLAIPQSVPSLPSTCQIEIVIEYAIYSFRKHVEVARSNSFTVIDHEPEEPISISPDNDNVVVENAPRQGASTSRAIPDPEPLPPPSATSPGEEENSPRVPPCDTLFLNLLITELCIRDTL